MEKRASGSFYLLPDPAVTWAWVLGDGLAGGVNCVAPIPPRKSLWGDPAASLTLGELMPAELVKVGHFRRDDRSELYGRMVAVVGKGGLFCRAPATRFSAVGFAEAYQKGRVTQTVSATVAEEAAGKLPAPVFFTHQRIPLFRDVDERQEALDLAQELVFATGRLEATWTRPDWGLGPADGRGDDHYMRAVLRTVERLDWDWETVKEREPWQRARRFFKSVRFAEQVFGVGWVAIVGE